MLIQQWNFEAEIFVRPALRGVVVAAALYRSGRSSGSASKNDSQENSAHCQNQAGGLFHLKQEA
jgi:hypothetical protein